MKRVISFLLVLVFCFSLACPAVAAVKSPGEDGPAHRPEHSDRWYPSFLGDNPKTGDIILFWAAVMVVSVAALGVVYMVYRRKLCR